MDNSQFVDEWESLGIVHAQNRADTPNKKPSRHSREGADKFRG
jgi:hypothetical protein